MNRLLIGSSFLLACVCCPSCRPQARVEIASTQPIAPVQVGSTSRPVVEVHAPTSRPIAEAHVQAAVKLGSKEQTTKTEITGSGNRVNNGCSWWEFGGVGVFAFFAGAHAPQPRYMKRWRWRRRP